MPAPTSGQHIHEFGHTQNVNVWGAHMRAVLGRDTQLLTSDYFDGTLFWPLMMLTSTALRSGGSITAKLSVDVNI